MANANTVNITMAADGTAFIKGVGQVTDSVKTAEAATKSWTDFIKGKMGPAMKAAMAEGLSHAEAHKKAINQIAAEWKVYKASGVEANRSVGSSYQDATDSMGSSGDNLVTRTKKATAKIKAQWLEVLAVIYSLKKAWDFAEQAANFQQAEQAFTNLAASHGANSRQMIQDLRNASAQAIATADLIKSAGTAMLLGIPADKLSKMLEIARASSRITGQTIQKSFDDIGLGTARQSRLILDNLGIIVKVEKANESYARALGKTASQLTDAEQKQAFMNAVMIAGEDTIKRVNIQGRTAAESMQAFVAALKNAGIVIGKVIITAVSAAVGALAWLATGMNQWISSVFDSLAWLVRLGEKIPFVGDKFRGLSKELEEDAKYMARLAETSMNLSMSSFDVATGIWKETEAIKINTGAQNDNAQATAATLEQKNKLIEAERQLAETAKRATLEALKNEAKLELDTLDREYELKAIKAEEYYGRKREIENRTFEESKARIMEAIAAENQLAETKLKTLTGQPVEVIQAAEVEHATKLIELGQEYRQIKNEQEQDELKNIYGIMDAEKELKTQKLAAQMELAALAEQTAYDTAIPGGLKDAAHASEIAQIYLNYQEKIQALQDYNTRKLGLMVDAGAIQAQVEAEYSDISIKTAKQEAQIRLQTYAALAGQMSLLTGQMYSATGEKMKAFFYLSKAFAIAQTIINTEMAAIAALAPPPIGLGPVAGAGLATAIKIMGYASAAMIAATAFTGAGTGGSSAGGATPSVSGNSPGAYPPVQKVEEADRKRPLEINLHVYGSVVDHDAFAREIVPSITKAINDGVR